MSVGTTKEILFEEDSVSSVECPPLELPPDSSDDEGQEILISNEVSKPVT